MKIIYYNFLFFLLVVVVAKSAWLENWFNYIENLNLFIFTHKRPVAGNKIHILMNTMNTPTKKRTFFFSRLCKKKKSAATINMHKSKSEMKYFICYSENGNGWWWSQMCKVKQQKKKIPPIYLPFPVKWFFLFKFMFAF